MGGAVAEWSKALLKREKINEKPKRSQVRPRPGHLLKKDGATEKLFLLEPPSFKAFKLFSFMESCLE